MTKKREEHVAEVYVCEKDGVWFRRDPLKHKKPVVIEPETYIDLETRETMLRHKVYKLFRMRSPYPISDVVIDALVKKEHVLKNSR